MPLVIPTEGEKALLQRSLNDNFIVHLFANDYTPTESDVIGDYIEVEDAQYETITLSGDNWIVSNDGLNVFAVYPQITFLFETGVTVYGYYMTDSLETTLLWAERFEDIGKFASSGGTLNIVPQIGLE